MASILLLSWGLLVFLDGPKVHSGEYTWEMTNTVPLEGKGYDYETIPIGSLFGQAGVRGNVHIDNGSIDVYFLNLSQFKQWKQGALGQNITFEKEVQDTDFNFPTWGNGSYYLVFDNSKDAMAKLVHLHGQIYQVGPIMDYSVAQEGFELGGVGVGILLLSPFYGNPLDECLRSLFACPHILLQDCLTAKERAILGASHIESKCVWILLTLPTSGIALFTLSFYSELSPLVTSIHASLGFLAIDTATRLFLFVFVGLILPVSLVLIASYFTIDLGSNLISRYKYRKLLKTKDVIFHLDTKQFAILKTELVSPRFLIVWSIISTYTFYIILTRNPLNNTMDIVPALLTLSLCLGYAAYISFHKACLESKINEMELFKSLKPFGALSYSLGIWVVFLMFTLLPPVLSASLPFSFERFFKDSSGLTYLAGQATMGAFSAFNNDRVSNMLSFLMKFKPIALFPLALVGWTSMFLLPTISSYISWKGKLVAILIGSLSLLLSFVTDLIFYLNGIQLPLDMAIVYKFLSFFVGLFMSDTYQRVTESIVLNEKSDAKSPC